MSIPAHTNDETEFLAIISVLRHFGADRDELVIYSDSRLIVSQISGSYESEKARIFLLKREVSRFRKPDHEIRWITRERNVARRRLEVHVFERRPASRIDEHEVARQTTLF